LLADLDDKSKMDWSDTTTTAQRNWLGRSEGAEIVFSGAAGQRGSGPADITPSATHVTLSAAKGPKPSGPEIRVFTTRPDTIFGATFMVLAPEHPLVDAFITPDHRAEV